MRPLYAISQLARVYIFIVEVIDTRFLSKCLCPLRIALLLSIEHTIKVLHKDLFLIIKNKNEFHQLTKVMFQR